MIKVSDYVKREGDFLDKSLVNDLSKKVIFQKRGFVNDRIRFPI